PSYSSTLIRRNFVFLGVIFVGAFGFEIAFDTISDRVWNNINKGRQWKDIRSKYLQNDEE
ncbi:cytochrome b-c1 complex subunit 9, partial [Xylogone sp. PMI_703]